MTSPHTLISAASAPPSAWSEPESAILLALFALIPLLLIAVFTFFESDSKSWEDRRSWQIWLSVSTYQVSLVSLAGALYAVARYIADTAGLSSFYIQIGALIGVGMIALVIGNIFSVVPRALATLDANIPPGKRAARNRIGMFMIYGIILGGIILPLLITLSGDSTPAS